MYKPSIFVHPRTKIESLQINLFELPTLNDALRKCFVADYTGKDWFWHRFVWRLPRSVFAVFEYISVMLISLFKSPKESLQILRSKIATLISSRKIDTSPEFNKVKVRSCFPEKDVKNLAKLIRQYYSSCLWQKGDILLVDNMKVAHAGMPGAGPRLVRAMICNPLDIRYSHSAPGVLSCKKRTSETIGYYMTSGTCPAKIAETEYC
jgi:hypothetical protein